MEKTDVYALIDELQEEIEVSPNALFSKNKSIDAKIIIEIIEDIRKAMDEEFEFANRLMREKDQIIKDAQMQAEEILKQAKAEADQLVHENTITRSAYERAAKLLETSKQKALEIRKSANTYAEDIFSELESYYQESIDIINENKARLYGKTDNSIQIEE